MKRVSLYWAALVGLLTIAAQVITFYIRFGNWNTDAFIVDYLLMFLAGMLGGLILISFLNRQASSERRWIILIAFLLGSPIALYVMILGGLFGLLGILILPQIPWALFTWLGSLVGRRVSRG